MQAMHRYLKKLNTFFIIMSKCSYVTTSISYMMARHCVLCDKNIQQNSLPWLFQCHNQSKVGRQRSNRDHLDSCRSSVHVAVQRCRIIHSSRIWLLLSVYSGEFRKNILLHCTLLILLFKSLLQSSLSHYSTQAPYSHYSIWQTKICKNFDYPIDHFLKKLIFFLF